MGFWARFKVVMGAKAEKSVTKMEANNMDETLDYSYQRQLDMLAKVKRGSADIATSRKQVENQINEIDVKINSLTSQAEKALSVDREDLAREALSRKAILAQQKSDLTIQRDQMAIEEEKILKTQRALQAKVEQFRVRKETVKASYKAAKANTQINEAFSGMNGEFQDVGLALSRAEDQTAEMQARSEAVGELMASGAFDDYNDTSWIDAELNEGVAESNIELELEQMRSAKALPAGSSK